ncbi:MAG: efflux RND transporter permease subunit [Myxococcales bacterium]|nr:efflux RND transporter permease subunit [Myxococcales bacterium]
MSEEKKRRQSFATARPVAVLMVFFAAIVFGYFSYSRLALRLMPAMSYPTITVRTEYPGAAPEEVETDISRPVEEALGVIAGLRRTSSVSRSGVSDVVLEFAWDTRMSDAIQATLEKLDLVVLPEEAGNSLILRFDPALEPVMELSVTSARVVATGEGDAELRRIRRISELQIKRALEPIKGVAAARVRGGLEEEIHVLLKGGALASAGLSLQRVTERLAQENINIAGGTIKDGGADYMVRTLGEFQSIEDIANTVVATRDGREIRVKDLGEVLSTHHEREMVTRSMTGGKGGESVQIDIFKEADANMVALSKRVRDVLGPLATPKEANELGGMRRDDTLVQELYGAEDLQLRIVGDRSLFIESSIAEVRNTAIIGGLFAVFVLFLFLKSVKSTLIIGASIPISLLVTFAPLNLMGVSLNIMSLGGLALGVGMLVDSSIVVLESIYRNEEKGKPRIEATIIGTHEVRGAVIASTLTTIGVFLPMVFVDGVAGQAFGDLGLAVVISLLVSLLVSLTLLPMLASRGGITGSGDAGDNEEARRLPYSPSVEPFHTFKADLGALPWVAKLPLLPLLLLRLALAMVLSLIAWMLMALLYWPLRLVGRLLPPLRAILSIVWFVPLFLVDTSLAVLRRSYPRFLRWSLRHGATLVGVMLLCLGLTYVLANRLESELLPEVHQGEFTFELSLPVGTTIEETVQILADVETVVTRDIPGIASVGITYGYDPANSRRSDEGEHTARYRIHLSEGGDNQSEEAKVADLIRTNLMEIPDLHTRLVRPVLFSFQTPIEVEIYGNNLHRLREMSERVQFEMQTLTALSDVETSLRRGAPEVQIIYERERMRRFNLNIADVARLVRDEIKGREATRFSRSDRKIPVVVRLAETDRATVEDLGRLIVDPEASGTIALSSVAQISPGEGPSEVRRVDGQRVAVVRANLRGGTSLGSAVGQVESLLTSRVEWPSDMHFAITGQNKEWEQSQRSLWLALCLSIFLVYVIMAAQFESLVYPLIIMVSIPLAFLGTFATLDALGMHLSIIVFLGMIMLAGIVVNNAIVLVDYINLLKSRGLGLEEAVMEAGNARLRPILMTTITTALGLLPMALGLGDGAELRTPLAISVISGLVVSTVLTLILIPTLYVLVDRMMGRLRSLLAGLSS